MRISDWSSDVCSSDLGAGASAGRTHIALATSHGFSGSYAAPSHGCYASVLAGEGSGMQRDYSSHKARHLSDTEERSEASRVGNEGGRTCILRWLPLI